MAPSTPVSEEDTPLAANSSSSTTPATTTTTATSTLAAAAAAASGPSNPKPKATTQQHHHDPLSRTYDPSKDNLPIEELLARPRFPRSPFEHDQARKRAFAVTTTTTTVPDPISIGILPKPTVPSNGERAADFEREKARVKAMVAEVAKMGSKTEEREEEEEKEQGGSSAGKSPSLISRFRRWMRD
jgi:hypothetical protein